MPLPTLLPGTDLKKDYKFIWYIGLDRIVQTGVDSDVIVQFRLLMNHVLTSYVSQLAEKVGLPEDSVDTDDYNIGNVSIPVPKKIPMPDITVTYLDDTNDTVYNFHKTWQSFVRNGDTFCMEPLYPYCLVGRYITIENTLNSLEHSKMLKALNKIDNEITNDTLMSLTHAADVFVKPRSIYNYPRLFPVRIQRTDADKSSSNVSRVTVTYKRLPEIKKPKNYQNLKFSRFFVSDYNSGREW